MDKARPNILFLMADQFRGDCIGAEGNAAIRTPNFDRIAREGALFRHAYTCLPSCTPVRATLLTGWAPWRHGMLGYGVVAERYANEKPRMLRDAGYYTAGFGKMHWFPQHNGHGFHELQVDESGRSETEGFVSDYRRWFREQTPDLDPDATGIGWNDYASGVYRLPEKLHPTRWTGDRAVEFLEDYEDERPFYLKVSFARPHSPYDPPQRFWEMYEDADVPAAVIGDWAERNAMHGCDLRPDTPRGDLGPVQPIRSRRGYYGAISFIDEQVGRILDVLERRGLLGSTLILFTSDHGDMLGDHHLWRKTFAYEGSARVPMLVRWPDAMTDAPRGQTPDQPVELRDVLPTFLDAAGAEIEEGRFDGRSLLDVIRGRTDGWREYIDLEHSTCYWPENQWTGLTDGHVKYIFYAPEGREELFDLDADPDELHECSADAEYAETLVLWRQRMVDHLSERGEQWVKDGKLVRRPEPMLYGPNYPGDATGG